MLHYLFMNKNLYTPQESERFMMDLTLYVSQSKIQSKIYYFNINLRDHRLKLRSSQNNWRLITFLLHCYHSALWYNRLYTIYFSSKFYVLNVDVIFLCRPYVGIWEILVGRLKSLVLLVLYSKFYIIGQKLASGIQESVLLRFKSVGALI